MAQNELGDEVSENILEKAKSEGSMKCPKYVCRDGEYGDKPPVANIGERTTSRFESVGNAEKYKVEDNQGGVCFSIFRSSEIDAVI